MAYSLKILKIPLQFSGTNNWLRLKVKIMATVQYLYFKRYVHRTVVQLLAARNSNNLRFSFSASIPKRI